MTSPIVGVAAVNALLFGVYGALLDWQMQSTTAATNAASQQTPRQPTLWQIFIAGSGSGVINAFISSPIELVKIRMQNAGVTQLLHPSTAATMMHSTHNTTTTTTTTTATATGPLQCARSIWQTGGVRGLYRGLGVTLVRETPSYGAYFLAYEVLCRQLAPPGTDPKELSGMRLMLAGGLGGIVGWASTYPIDVVKTMVQDDVSGRRMPLWHTLITLYRQQGIHSWFRGFIATVLRAFPTNVAILSTWHLSMMQFRQMGLLNSGT
jgi:solute carrier family 25 carnitine/acylcarnitine transporter 20/29